MDIDRVILILELIRDYLKLYGNESIKSSFIALNNSIDILKSETCGNKEEYILQMYKSLFSPKSELSEFYIWDNDYEKRITLNRPLDKNREELWKCIKAFL